MSTKKIIEIRNLLETEVKKALGRRGSVDTLELIREFKGSHQTSLKQANDQLLDIALNKLIGDIRQRKKHGLWTEPQQTLFADLRGIRQSLIVKDKDGKKLNKILPRVTVGELEDWLHNETKPMSRAEKHKQLTLLLNLIMPFAESLDVTIEEALRNQKAGLKPSKRRG